MLNERWKRCCCLELRSGEGRDKLSLVGSWRGIGDGQAERDFKAGHKVSIKIYKMSIGLNIRVNLGYYKKGVYLCTVHPVPIRIRASQKQPSTHQVIRMSFSSVPQFSLSLGLPATRDGDGVLVYIQYWNPR